MRLIAPQSNAQAIYTGSNYQIKFNADFGFELTQNRVYDFAKEVIDRYASEISKIVKEQRTAIAEEINFGEVNPAYSLSGSQEKNFWIDEICGAQLFSLGKLVRYDITKPLPATFSYDENETREDLQNVWHAYSAGEGRISVKNNNKEVVGVGTSFVAEDDVNREIIIRDQKC
jgi:hypothetical protein